MKTINTKKIRKKLEKQLDAKRYEHTLGVAYTASALAMCNQTDIDRALIAGLLHDCAKCMSNEKKISICKKEDIPITKIEEKIHFCCMPRLADTWPKNNFTFMMKTS